MEKYLSGDQVLTRFAPFGIKRFQIYECIQNGLTAYWADGCVFKRIVDKSLILKKNHALAEARRKLKSENKQLSSADIESLALKRCKERYPELPWDGDYYAMNLAPFGRAFSLPHTPLFLYYNRGILTLA